MITRIRAYGDSFTTGEELADYELLGMTERDCDNYKKSLKCTYGEFLMRFHELPPNFNRIDSYGREIIQSKKTWHYQLAKKFNVENVFKAYPGAPIDLTYYDIFTDYVNGDILETDLVLVGLQPTIRMLAFNRKKIPNPFDVYVINEPFQVKVNPYTEIDLFNDDYIIYHYYKAILSISLLPINLAFVPMVAWIHPSQPEFNYDLCQETKTFIDNVLKFAGKKFTDPSDYLKIERPDDFLSYWLHTNDYSHKNYAERLAPQLEYFFK